MQNMPSLTEGGPADEREFQIQRVCGNGDDPATGGGVSTLRDTALAGYFSTVFLTDMKSPSVVSYSGQIRNAGIALDRQICR